MSKEFFTIGATVFDGNGKEWKIGKIHKNGNFKVDGLPSRQFRPYNDGSAFETGGAWAKMHMYADTPERRVIVEKTKALNRAKRILEIEIERLRTLQSIAKREPEIVIKEALRIQEVNATFGR